MRQDEVDRRFATLAASLNSWVVPTDRVLVADPRGRPGEGRRPHERGPGAASRVVALRIVALLTAVPVGVAGASVHWSRSAPFAFWPVWLLVVVPAVTLLAVLAFDRVRGGGRLGSS